MLDGADWLQDAAPTAWAAGRALTAGALAAAGGPGASALLDRPSRAAWVAMAMLAIAPPVLAGYAYASAATALIHYPALSEMLLAMLLAARALPFVAVAGLVVRPRTGPEARHVWGMLDPARRAAAWRTGLGIRLAGPAGARLTYGLAAALLAFGDFELAALLGRPSWTVAVFDAQAGGEPLARTLGRCVPPFMASLGILAAAVVAARWALTARDATDPVAPGSAGAGPFVSGAGAGALALAAGATANVLAPLAIVLATAAPTGSWPRIVGPVAREIGVAVLFALASATCAAALASRARRAPLALALAVPGLMGALPVGLALLAAFRQPWLRSLRDGPVPLWLGQMLVLMPAAVLLDRLAGRWVPAESAWPAETLAASPDRGQRRAGRYLRWMLAGRARGAGLFALFGLAYGELPAGALLAPAGFAPIASRLYNQAHYGRSAALSAMMLATLAVPLAAALAAARWGAPRRP